MYHASSFWDVVMITDAAYTQTGSPPYRLIYNALALGYQNLSTISCGSAWTIHIVTIGY